MDITENEINLNQEISNNIDNIVENDIVTEERQNSFIESTLGKTINTALDIGLRVVLPDLIEDQVIDIKDSILKNGLKEGISSAINSAIDIGKSALGIVTGKFENISQVNAAIKKGGIIDSISNSIDTAVKASQKNGLIQSTTAELIKKGKNVILNTISDNIEDKFTSQIKAIEKIGKYTSNWNEYYNKKDLNGMEREYKKIKEQLSEIVPMENTIKEARKIENIHNLVKSKGIDYELSEDEKELLNKLI